MAYPKGGSLWTGSVASSWAARATFLSVATLALVGIGLALHGTSQHQAVNRADKADSLVNSAALKAKRDLNVAWYRFFHERQLADPRASNQFDGVAIAADVRLEKVAVNEGNYFAW